MPILNPGTQYKDSMQVIIPGTQSLVSIQVLMQSIQVSKSLSQAGGNMPLVEPKIPRCWCYMLLVNGSKCVCQWGVLPFLHKCIVSNASSINLKRFIPDFCSIRGITRVLGLDVGSRYRGVVPLNYGESFEVPKDGGLNVSLVPRIRFMRFQRSCRGRSKGVKVWVPKAISKERYKYEVSKYPKVVLYGVCRQGKFGCTSSGF